MLRGDAFFPAAQSGGGTAAFEWRRGGTDVWDIAVESAAGEALLLRSVRTLLAGNRVLVPPHALPQTSSGKLSRSRARSNYLQGQYGQTAEMVLADS